MKTKILLPVVAMVFIASAIFVSAALQGYNTEDRTITYHIKKGWNLLPTTAWEIQKSDSPIKTRDFKYGFLYNRISKQYELVLKDGQFESNNQSIANEDLYYLALSSMWIYSEKEGDYTMQWANDSGFNNDLFKFTNYKLKKGWNFLFITPQMKLKKTSEFKGTCNIEKYALWEEQKWKLITPQALSQAGSSMDDAIFADIDSDVGGGIVVKVRDDCTFGEGEISSPPIFPE